MSVTLTTRIYLPWVDLAKALGIFAIVFAHTITKGNVSHYVYSFHVPLFFFLSGYVFTTKEKTYPAFLLKKAKALLIPYLVFAIAGIAVFGVLGGLIEDALADNRTIGNLEDQLVELCLGYCDTNAPLWFLPCMFVTCNLAYPISKGLDRIKDSRGKAWILAAIGGLCILWNVLNAKIFDFYHLPFKLETALTLLFFFFLGYAMREFSLMELLSRLRYMVKVPLTAALLILGGALAMLNEKVSYLGNYSGNMLLFYPSAVCTILGLVLLCSLVKKCAPLQYIGQHTTAIMVMHKFPVILFQAVIPGVSALIAKNSALAGIVVTAVCIGLCLAVELLIDLVCPIILGKNRKKAAKS